MIGIDGVTWTYSGAAEPTLRDLDLRVAPGECVVVCGASGSGKSTALRLVNGLIPHFHDGTLAGEVTVNGRDVAGSALDVLGRESGTVLQHPRRQFFTETATTEIAFALENFGAEPAGIRARVRELVAGIDAEHWADRRLRDLSGGQQQLAACAAAVSHRPGILLLDEPSANLSAAAVDRLAAMLSDLRDRGVTLLVAEHRLGYLRDLADRVVCLADGRRLAEWSREQFARLDDDALGRYGLRGTTPSTAALPAPPEPPDDRTAAGLTLRDVVCRRGGTTVVSVDRAHFPAGRVTALRGPNGAGKTTLARVIVGLRRHRGTVLVDGVPLSRARRQQLCSLVMQDTDRQMFTESVDAELELTARYARAGPAASAEDLLGELDLHSVRDRHPLSLSGGQQQRLAVATTLLSGRRVVIFDEPSSGVDRRHLLGLAGLIRSAAERSGAVVLLISHDDELLAATADHAVELSRQPWALRRDSQNSA